MTASRRRQLVNRALRVWDRFKVYVGEGDDGYYRAIVAWENLCSIRQQLVEDKAVRVSGDSSPRRKRQSHPLRLPPGLDNRPLA
jgi:hypothetical protein